MGGCDLGTDCLCTEAMRATCEFSASPAPPPVRPADRFLTAVVILCTSVGFLAGALFMRVVS